MTSTTETSSTKPMSSMLAWPVAAAATLAGFTFAPALLGLVFTKFVPLVIASTVLGGGALAVSAGISTADKTFGEKFKDNAASFFGGLKKGLGFIAAAYKTVGHDVKSIANMGDKWAKEQETKLADAPDTSSSALGGVSMDDFTKAAGRAPANDTVKVATPALKKTPAPGA